MLKPCSKKHVQELTHYNRGIKDKNVPIEHGDHGHHHDHSDRMGNCSA